MTTLHNIDTLFNNLTIQETSFQENEPTVIQRILKDLDIILFFLENNHNVLTRQKFVRSCIQTFNIYLTQCVFDSHTYISYPKEFLEEMTNIRKGIIYFIDYLDEDNLEYNMSFIKEISKTLQNFIRYHYYVSGCLV